MMSYEHVIMHLGTPFVYSWGKAIWKEPIQVHQYVIPWEWYILHLWATLNTCT